MNTLKDSDEDYCHPPPCSACLRKLDQRIRSLRRAVAIGQCDTDAAEQEIEMLTIAATVPNAPFQTPGGTRKPYD
jgi:hypothetical protein